jgi:hypothetical protein
MPPLGADRCLPPHRCRLLVDFVEPGLLWTLRVVRRRPHPQRWTQIVSSPLSYTAMMESLLRPVSHIPWTDIECDPGRLLWCVSPSPLCVCLVRVHVSRQTGTSPAKGQQSVCEVRRFVYFFPHCCTTTAHPVQTHHCCTVYTFRSNLSGLNLTFFRPTKTLCSGFTVPSTSLSTRSVL